MEGNESTPVWKIILAWIFVLAPMIWGVTETLLKSFDLFR